MKLDSRILEGKKPLDCFDTDIAKQFIGKECYLSNYLCNFNDINSIAPRALLHNITEDKDASNPYYSCPGYFAYCLPCEWVEEEKKEPKYRPYTLTEFVNTYSLGDEVIMRSKNSPTIKHILFIEYEEGGMDVRLGQHWYTFTLLFVNYEIYTDEGWKPFGVEEHYENQ